MVKEKTLAELYFKTQHELWTLEDQISRTFDEEGVAVEEFHCDYYDNSIEVYTNGYRVSEEALALIKDMGFGKVWWHYNLSSGLRGSADKDATYHVL